ncbi:MAG: N-formylglutamate amidohydrolase, partial [Pontibacter sp.]|nr:N-formylglutamate amidohydrolase [Pontibacter sp.]
MLTFVLTCEHGGNNIPAAYQALFKGHEKVLNTHAGYDIGGLELFNELKPLADYSFYSETSRLLVELNRSLHHQKLFSDISQILPDKEKERVLDKYYFPY